MKQEGEGFEHEDWLQMSLQIWPQFKPSPLDGLLMSSSGDSWIFKEALL